MEKAKIIIYVYLLYRVGMLIIVYLTQGFSKYFTGNQYFQYSILFLSPVFLFGIWALINLGGEVKTDQLKQG